MREMMKSTDITGMISDYISKADIVLLSGKSICWPRDELMAALKTVKESCKIINTARGSLLDEEILYQLLSQRKIERYFTDVLHHEPPTGLSAKLISLDNVFSTPHIGGYSRKALLEVAYNCVNFLLEK